MSATENKDILVIDNGLFQPFAHALTRHFRTVFYYVPEAERAFKLPSDYAIGDGFDYLIRVDEPFEEVVDIVAFPDAGMPYLQRHFKSLGIPVFGSGDCSKLELNRKFLKQFQAEHNMPVPPWIAVKGMLALYRELDRRESEKHGDCYVKVSKYRGLMETFHHINMDLSRPWLDALMVKLGPLSDTMEFIIEEPIKAVAEIGFDGFVVDGQFPKVGVQGIEAKDQGYIASVVSELPKEITQVNDALAGYFRDNQYRGFFSTEIRVTEDGTAYLTDPTCRHASPAGECLLQLYNNLGDIVWGAANGIMVEPEYSAEFAAQAMITTKRDPKAWRMVSLKEWEMDDIKIYSCCRIGDTIGIPPLAWSDETIGSVVATGDSIKKAIDNLKMLSTRLTDQGLTVHTEALADVLDTIQSEEKSGVEFTDKPVPDPQVVL